MKQICKILIRQLQDIKTASLEQDRYAEALENESSIENISPKEKAMKLLDDISESLKGFGSSADNIRAKAAELREL